LPLTAVKEGGRPKKIAYIGIGISGDNAFAKRMRKDYGADVFYFNYKQDASRVLSIVQLAKSRYDAVVVGVHGYGPGVANNFGISKAAMQLLQQLQQQQKSIILAFGNSYALKYCCDASNVLACYEDDDIFQEAAADILSGKNNAKGKLPVTVCEQFRYGNGIVKKKDFQ
jgi:beta-N-acetylhexosaminidase